jgi:hypothetical protein
MQIIIKKGVVGGYINELTSFSIYKIIKMNILTFELF